MKEVPESDSSSEILAGRERGQRDLAVTSASPRNEQLTVAISLLAHFGRIGRLQISSLSRRVLKRWREASNSFAMQTGVWKGPSESLVIFVPCHEHYLISCVKCNSICRDDLTALTCIKPRRK